MAGMGLTLKGLIPATVTPLFSDGSLDTPALEAHLHSLTNAGIGGLAVNMDTGEGASLTADEGHTVVEIAVTVADGHVPVLAGVGGARTQDAVASATAAAAAGADAIVVFPHPVFSGDPATVVPHHRAVIAAADLPTVIFQLQPALGGVLFDAGTLETLISIPEVVALKEASFDPIVFAETRDRLAGSGVALLTGNDNFAVESLLLGATGSLIGLGSVFCRSQARIHTMVAEGDVTAAQRADETFLGPLARLLFAEPVGRYRARVKEALVCLGEIPDASVRPPLLPLDSEEVKHLRATIEELDTCKP